MSSEYTSPLDQIRGILEKSQSQEVDPDLTQKLIKNSSISSEKMLLNYSSDNPRIYHTTLKDIFNAYIAVHTKLSEGFKKAIPIMLIFGGVMVVALIMGNMPTVINSIANNFGVEKQIITETQVKVVHLTPEEAREQGIEVPETPPGVEPNPEQRENPPNIVPDDVKISPEEAENNPRTEGFDVAGNLIPKPIPFETSNTPNNQKTCDEANGYSRHWDGGDLNEDGNTGEWMCLNDEGQQKLKNGEKILPEDIGTYEVRN